MYFYTESSLSIMRNVFNSGKIKGPFFVILQAEPEVQNIVQTQFGGEYFYVTE